ncbi:MAG: MBL fold metallo-hydrolase, partial [Candidatus Paceibacterales bacterium]
MEGWVKVRIKFVLMICFLVGFNFAFAQTNNSVPTSSFEIFMIADEVKVIRILPSVYVIEDQGGIPSYSMIVDISDDNLLLVDTTNPEKTKSILRWANKNFDNKKIVAINTHHHSDRTGGNAVLMSAGIPVYGSDLTASLATEEGEIAPNNTFPINNGKTLNFDNKKVEIFYPGPAHTQDN